MRKRQPATLTGSLIRHLSSTACQSPPADRRRSRTTIIASTPIINYQHICYHLPPSCRTSDLHTHTMIILFVLYYILFFIFYYILFIAVRCVIVLSITNTSAKVIHLKDTNNKLFCTIFYSTKCCCFRLRRGTSHRRRLIKPTNIYLNQPKSTLHSPSPTGSRQVFVWIVNYYNMNDFNKTVNNHIENRSFCRLGTILK